MDFDTIGEMVALRVHDPSQVEITDTQYGLLVNSAIDDLSGAGVVLPLEEDESLTFSTTTFQYNVPAGFAFIQELRLESSASSGKYPTAIHPSLWTVVLDGAAAKFQFDENEAPMSTWNGLKMKIRGQQRVPQLTGADTVEPGLEAFIRERTVAYAAEFVAGGESELAAQRRRLSEVAWERSERLLARIPPMYRISPDSKRVPGR